MASEQWLARIRENAQFLNTPTAKKAQGRLDPALETALRVIQCFSDGKPKDYEDIKEATGINLETVKQVIRALESGGYPLQFGWAEISDRTQTTGRPRRSIKRVKKNE